MASGLCGSAGELLAVLATMILLLCSEMQTKEVVINPTVIAAQNNLLSLFGFRRRPSPSSINKNNTNIPKAMMELYRKQMSMEYASPMLSLPGRHTRSANTARSYIHQESDIDERFPHDHKFRLNFDISNIPDNEVITAAELKLNLVPKDSKISIENRGKQRIFLHDIVKPGIKGETKPILRLVDTRIVDINTNDSVSLDMMPFIERWKQDNSNHGVLVQVNALGGEKVKNSHIRLRRSTSDTKENWDKVQPTLFVYSDDHRYKPVEDLTKLRKIRNTDEKPGRKSKHCQRHPLYVDFELVGWNDWIIAPPGYEAYYCKGECPSVLSDHLNATNHAIVQNFVNSVHPQIPKPCCVPTQLAPMSLLYLDEDSKSVLKTYQEMVVVGCGCR